MAALAGALVLWGGCARIAVQEPDGNHTIGFAPGVKLLQDEYPTKAGILKEGDFESGDQIAVFGRRHGNNQTTDVFNGTIVKKNSTSEWEYSPIKGWYWLTEGDYYDFLAVYPSDKGTYIMDVPGNLAIQTHYRVDNDQYNYDLMYALYRRHGSDNDRTSAVPLVFNHALSAVRIIFDNNSNTENITINSYEFTHMIVDAYAKATVDVIGNPEIIWINTIRNANAIGHVDPESPLAGNNQSGEHSYTGDFCFMIPTALDATSNGIEGDQEHMPHLVVRFTPEGQSAIETSILLKSIQKDPFNGDSTPVDVWEPGLRYTYHISIRLDGGVQVFVVTTDWDDIYSETPGVMIN